MNRSNTIFWNRVVSTDLTEAGIQRKRRAAPPIHRDWKNLMSVLPLAFESAAPTVLPQRHGSMESSILNRRPIVEIQDVRTQLRVQVMVLRYQWGSTGLFGQFFTAVIEHERDMEIAQWGGAERLVSNICRGVLSIRSAPRTMSVTP